MREDNETPRHGWIKQADELCILHNDAYNDLLKQIYDGSDEPVIDTKELPLTEQS